MSLYMYIIQYTLNSESQSLYKKKIYIHGSINNQFKCYDSFLLSLLLIGYGEVHTIMGMYLFTSKRY